MDVSKAAKIISRMKKLKNLSDADAIAMILSAYVDYGSEAGSLISVRRFPEVSEAILLYFDQRLLPESECEE